MKLFKQFQKTEDVNEWIDDNDYDSEDDEYDAYGVPIGCSACGGDYPNCKDSCPMFDD